MPNDDRQNSCLLGMTVIYSGLYEDVIKLVAEDAGRSRRLSMPAVTRLRERLVEEIQQAVTLWALSPRVTDLSREKPRAAADAYVVVAVAGLDGPKLRTVMVSDSHTVYTVSVTR